MQDYHRKSSFFRSRNAQNRNTSPLNKKLLTKPLTGVSWILLFKAAFNGEPWSRFSGIGMQLASKRTILPGGKRWGEKREPGIQRMKPGFIFERRARK
jgi:hypothetical protein